jgi:hypothetical protein
MTPGETFAEQRLLVPLPSLEGYHQEKPFVAIPLFPSIILRKGAEVAIEEQRKKMSSSLCPLGKYCLP